MKRSLLLFSVFILTSLFFVKNVKAETILWKDIQKFYEDSLSNSDEYTFSKTDDSFTITKTYTDLGDYSMKFIYNESTNTISYTSDRDISNLDDESKVKLLDNNGAVAESLLIVIENLYINKPFTNDITEDNLPDYGVLIEAQDMTYQGDKYSGGKYIKKMTVDLTKLDKKVRPENYINQTEDENIKENTETDNNSQSDVKESKKLTEKNPKTGITNYYIYSIPCIIISFIGILVLKNKKMFNK